MKNKTTWLMALLLVLLIGGAYALYNQLSGQVDMPQLVLQGTAPQKTDENQTPEKENETVGNENETPGNENEAPGNENEAPGNENETPDKENENDTHSALAPDFTVYDLEGKPVQLSDFRGKPVVLNFWSSRCGPCQMQMPDFQKAYEDLGEKIHFLMVNVTDGSWDTVASASAFISKNNYTFPVFFDTDISAAAAYGISSLPTTYFIDAKGNGVAYGVGALDLETLMSGIAMITEN